MSGIRIGGLPGRDPSAAAQSPGAAQPAGTQTALDRGVQKSMRRLVPFLILMYMIAFLDRSNVGVAKQALHSSVGLSDASYAFGAGIFFVGYAIFEFPSNLILHRVGARIWIARIMISWGLVSAATMFVVGDKSFTGIRFLLGLAEAGFFPGIILYITYWFPARQRARVLGLFYFGFPMAMALGSPMSGALLSLDRLLGLQGWQWMFLIEGLAAVVVGFITLRILPDRPEDVDWLDREEKQALAETLAQEQQAKAGARGTSLMAGLRSWDLLHFVAIYFMLQIGSYGVVFYLPEQISNLLGLKIGFRVGLFTALPWVFAIGVAAFWPGLAQRLGRPRLFFIVCLVGTAGGLVVSAYALPVLAMAALCVAASGIISAQAIFWTYPTSRFGGVAAAGTIAVINSLGNLGGFLAPNVRSFASRSWHTPIAGLYALAIASVLAVVLAIFLPAKGFGAAAAATPQPRA